MNCQTCGTLIRCSLSCHDCMQEWLLESMKKQFVMDTNVIAYFDDGEDNLEIQGLMEELDRIIEVRENL